MKRIAMSLAAVALLAIVSFGFPVVETVSALNTMITGLFLSGIAEARSTESDQKEPSAIMSPTVVFSDDFSANSSTTWTTTGTIGASSWSVSRSGVDWGARRNTSPQQLELSNDTSVTANANGWSFASVPLNTIPAPYSATLSSNPGLVTWQFNMRQIRPDPAGFSSTSSYGVAYIISTNSTSPDIGIGKTGYAVTLGESGTVDPIHLVRFSGGLQGTITPIIDSNTAGLTDFGAEYLSVRVTYNPANNQWELFLRNDGTTAFADPGTGTLVSQGTVVDSTYANTAFTNMGGYWQGSTTASQTAFFDNVSISVDQPTPPNTPPIAVDDNLTGVMDTPLNIPAATLTSNDIDPDAGQTLTVTSVSNAINGSVSLSAGVITFTPSSGFTGPASFDYTVSDGFAVDVGIVNVTVLPANNGQFNFNQQVYSPNEADGTVTLTVTRTGGTDGAVTVDYGVVAAGLNIKRPNVVVASATGGAACLSGSGVDYVTPSGTLNFADGDSSKTINVTICDDQLFELTENFAVTLSNATGGATIGTTSAGSVNILDDDTQPSLQFSAANFDVNENAGTATVTVTRTGATEHVLSVNYSAVTGGSATAGTCGAFSGNDFEPTSGTLNFAAGDNSETFDITICNDGLFEASNETILIALNTQSAPALLGTPNSGTVTIIPNVDPPSVEFSSATSSIGEGAGTKTFTVNRTGATENSFSVNFATANGTALSGSCGSGGDYVSNSGTLNFAGGDPNKTFNVTICDDGLFEDDETFTATLSSPTGGALIGTNGTETVTISENDLTPIIQFSTDRYAGTEGSGVTVSIVRTGALDNDVTADLNAGAGAGAACGQPGVDYELSNVTVHFAPGETLKQFGVPLCWEFLYEGNESWDMQLSNPTGGANIGSQSFAFIDITDSDTPPKFAFSSSAISVPENTGTVTLNVNRTGASQNVVSVDYATTGGTATGGNCLSPGSDFLIQTGQLNFAAGDTSKTFDITICDDAEFEGDESFTVSLSNPQFPAQLGTVTTETITILANDSVPEMDLLGNSVSIPDGDTTPSLADHTDFGAISAASGTVSRTFTIANTGTGNLDLSGTPKVEISGTNAADFSVTVQPGSPVVGPSGTTTFTVVFDPSAVGLRTATLNIANNDSDEDPYDFTVQGTGTAPVASFTATPNPAACNQLVGFNASGSTQADPSRPIVSYSWDFGDGQNGTGVSLTHAYSAFGTYTVVLTITDDVGAQDTESQNVSVSLGNQPPVASTGGPYIITSGNGVSLNGTGSTDPNSGCGDSIVVYEWDLDNDGQFDDATGASPNLSAATVTSLFPTLNTPYTIGLRVIDEFGSQGTASTTLAVYQNAPIAAFTAIPNPAACNQTINFNGTGSSHPNPTRSIVSYSWDFGDTTSGTGSTTTHAYSAFGTFNAVLTVTDNTGAQDTESLFVTVSQGNQPPVANAGGPYSAILGSGIGVSLDGSGSTDPNTGCGDSIVSFAWNIASGTYNLTGSNPSLTYAQIVSLGAGSHPVQLTVTDGFGATGVSNTTLTVSSNVTLVVDNLTDDAALNQCTAATGDCSLRGANSIANNGDTIVFDPAVFNLRSEAPSGVLTIDLVNGQILIDNDITITGPGANLLTIKRNSVSNFRIFAVNPGITANISGLTISNGFGSAAAPGGGIYNDHGTVTITDCVISGNFGPGAGIYNDGNTSGTASLTITNSTISGNNSNFNGGGGIFNTAHFGGNASVSIANSTISDNVSEDGGAIMNNANGGTTLMTITNSTISGNTATRFGGGFRNEGGLVLTNVTVTNNRGNSDGDVSGQGGGIFLQGLTQPILKNTIIAGNVQGAGPGTTPNDIDQCCVDPISSFNLIGTGGSGGLVDGVNSNQVGIADARLGPLQNNGGPVFTHGFNNSNGLSPAIDKGSAFGSTFDARGLPRTVDLPSIPNATGGDGTDIGAYELQAPTAAPVSISGRVRTVDGRGVRGAIVSITDGNGTIRQVTTSTFGYYRFEGVTAGESYFVGVASKRYRFASIFVNVTDELSGLDFYPEP